MSPTRGITDVLGYLLSLSIVLIILAGLSTTGFLVLDSADDISANATLERVGQTAAADIEQADRTIRAGRSTVTQRVLFPQEVRDNSYRVAVLNETTAGTSTYRYGTLCESQCLLLYTETGDAIQTTPLLTELPVQSAVFDARPAQILTRNGTLTLSPIGADI